LSPARWLRALGAPGAAAALRASTGSTYCGIYTPMKTMSWWNTAVGTLPGALPVMIGWTAAGGGLWDAQGWILTLVVILWQFPHFMAIAWLYRDQYKQAGFRMLTGEEPSGKAAAWHALLPAVVLIPVSMLVMQPTNLGSWIFAILGALVCLPQVRSSLRFLVQRDDPRARVLLRASLVYLPAILLLAVVRWVVL
ncbi:MAG: protoheme IX farnesyltransferase, partial [Planctomycetota bacterium]